MLFSRRVSNLQVGEYQVKNLMTLARQFRDDENGAALIEYTVLLGIMVAAVILTIVAVGGWINNKWTLFETAVNP